MFQKNRLRSIILEESIRRAKVTRREIAEISATRLASVTEAVNSLLEEGLLEEPSRKGVNTGRRAPQLSLRGDYGHFWGIGLSQNELHVVLIDTAGNLLTMEKSALPPQAKTETIFRQTGDISEKLLEGLKNKGKLSILGAGFADPGLVDESRGISIKAVNLPYWENIATRDKLGTRLACPVYLRTEMASRAYAERLLEGNGGTGGTFHLYVGHGVGGAYTRGLELFTGDSSCPMEIGHLVVEENGALCQCGNRGCLEAYAGSDGIARRVEQLRNKAVPSLLVEAPYSPEHFVHAVKTGDKAAVRLGIETAQHVGKALAATTNLINPARISLSGPLFSLDNLLLSVLKQSLTLHCLPQALTQLEWHISTLKDEAPALGAALMARHCILKDRISLKK